MDIGVILVLAAEGLFALLLLYSSGVLKDLRLLVAAAVLICAALVVRATLFDYQSYDYRDFLDGWVEFFRTHGGFKALGRPVGNYNIPYLYFLAAFSYLDIIPLYPIKLLSVFFDIILAWAVMKLVGLYKRGEGARFVAFICVLFLPTVILNGACWGQCDSIFAAFAILAIYLVLDGKPAAGMICMAVSFAFKLQAVFIMPIFVVFLIAKKVRWQHFLLFPVTYVVLILPAVLLGRPFWDTLTIYISQAAGTTSSLNFNSPSVYAVFRNVKDTALASSLGILCAFGFMLLIFVSASRRGSLLSKNAMLGAAMLFCVGIPFLLPHMHDRYFYVADVMSMALAVVSPWFIPAALLTQFASYNSYYAYLRGKYLFYNNYGAAALIIVLAISLVFFLSGMRAKNISKK